MTGWPAVVVTTGLMTVAMVGFNIRLWRRMRAATEVAKRAAISCDLPLGSGIVVDGGNGELLLAIDRRETECLAWRAGDPVKWGVADPETGLVCVGSRSSPSARPKFDG